MSSEKNPTRTRILSATRTLLETQGTAAVRMSDIAKAAKISRQALYLHFPNRAELLRATVRWLDEVYDIEERLRPSRSAPDGRTRLNAWISVWGGYIPQIQGVARALQAMRDTDAEAKAAWDDRMTAVRHGCAAVVSALVADGLLTPDLAEDEATDLLHALLSVQTWEQLCKDSAWPQERYIAVMQQTAERALIRTV
nr:TetR/AcrR family transcriptional regulator [uncultured Roseobacter sp.]